MTRIIDTMSIKSNRGYATMLIIDPPVPIHERGGNSVLVSGEVFQKILAYPPRDHCVEINGKHDDLVGKELIFDNAPNYPKN